MVVICICSFWILYNFLSLVLGLPYISLLPGLEGVWRGVASVFLGWSLPVALYGVFFSVIGTLKHQPLTIFVKIMMVVYILYSLILII